MKLRVVTQEDLELLKKWVAREDLKESAGAIDPDLRKPFELFLIETSDEKLVGWTSLYNIDNKNQTCQVGLVIAETEGSRVALQAMTRTLFYAFTSLNINQVEARVLSTNKRCLKLISKGKSPWGSSFSFEGKLRNRISTPKGFLDIEVFSISKEEFLRGDNNGRRSVRDTERGSSRTSTRPESAEPVELVNAVDDGRDGERSAGVSGPVHSESIPGITSGSGSTPAITESTGFNGPKRRNSKRSSNKSE